MIQALAELRHEFQLLNSDLTLYRGLPGEILSEAIPRLNIEAVFVNRDYTPFSRARDEELARLCQTLNVDFISCPDYLLNEPEAVLKKDRRPYRVFSAFYNAAKRLPVGLPEDLHNPAFIQDKPRPKNEEAMLDQAHQTTAALPGGRHSALDILKRLQDAADYQHTRDFPALDATTRLSAHLKFGTCSIREAYYAIQDQLGEEHPLLRQLYWRDFFTHAVFHYPYLFGKAFIDQFDRLPWNNDSSAFQRWCEGMTGFPIVDAGMRELNATGFMHNRVRMITASFLVKDLHMDWRWGERYFAQRLMDYDPAVNNGNWQWIASTGCDAQPYFRIFNPWLQQRKFDRDCAYIKRWIPELISYPARVIHHWDGRHDQNSYPPPMLDHDRESRFAKNFYRELSSNRREAVV